jgi:host factor-I protein
MQAQELKVQEFRYSLHVNLILITKGSLPMSLSEKQNNLQDIFLNQLRKTKAPVTLFLVNGVKLQGIVTWFDNFSVLLRRDNHSQLVYKHAISTVMPINPIQLFEEEEEEKTTEEEKV